MEPLGFTTKGPALQAQTVTLMVPILPACSYGKGSMGHQYGGISGG